jgi:hypothetical protein
MAMKGQNMDCENPIKLLAVQARDENGGFYLAFVPQELADAQMRAAFAEVNIEPLATLEVGGWQTTSQNVMVVFIPFPQPSLWSAVQTPSCS